jgi:indole-3-glycerol phosphate synthase
MTKQSILEEIVAYTKDRVESDKVRVSLHELQRRIKDAPPIVEFGDALSREPSFGLIGEIKRKSPSVKSMREQNVKDAPIAYQGHNLVKAVSVLTNDKYFGMNIEELGRLRNIIGKPILRKDFIIDEYQIYEARAYGADAVLLMANVLAPLEMGRLWVVCKSLGMEALFESHSEEQIASLPKDARVFGINSRKLDSSKLFFGISRFSFSKLVGKDYTPIRGRFEMISKLPKQCIKVAESGVDGGNIAAVRDQGWNAALVGAALLTDSGGVEAALRKLEHALNVPDREPAEMPNAAHPPVRPTTLSPSA